MAGHPAREARLTAGLSKAPVAAPVRTSGRPTVTTPGLDWLFDRLAGWGDHPAIVRDDGVWSYAWLIARAAEWREVFEALGDAARSVSVEADFGPESCAVLLALLARGAVVVPLGDAMPAATADTLRAVPSVGVRVIGPEPLRVEVHERAVEHPLLVSQVARGRGTIVLFTTGSTGIARAAAHDAASFLEKFRVPGSRLRTCAFLLFDHIGGQNTLFHTLASGGTLVCPAARDADTVCAAIARHGVELLPTSPTFLNLMLLGGAHRRHDLRSLRLVSYGTEPMPASTLGALGSALPEVRFKQTYGLSEVGILRTQSRADDSLWMRVGGPEYETRIVEGTLRVRPRHGMLGYLNAPSPFDANGWMDTGDVVVEDGDWLRMVGRRRDEINVGGLKVHPVEVESVLLDLPGVIDATVRGGAHPLTGQVVVARVTLAEQDGGDPGPEVRRRLRRACIARLAPHMVPARFEFATEPQHSARFKRQRPESGAAEPGPAPHLPLSGEAAEAAPAPRLDGLRDRYLEPTPDRRVDQYFMQLLADALVPSIRGPRVLELGVGDQVWTPRLCAAVPQVTTVEGARTLLEPLRERMMSPGWTGVHALFEDYLPTERFDGVVATFVLEHVDDPTVIVERAARHWLRPGGELHVVVPHAHSLHRRLAVVMGLAEHVTDLGPTDQYLDHRRCFTLAALAALLGRAGFAIEERRGFLCKPLPNRDLVNLTSPQLAGLFQLGCELPIEFAATIYVRGRLQHHSGRSA